MIFAYHQNLKELFEDLETLHEHKTEFNSEGLLSCTVCEWNEIIIWRPYSPLKITTILE